jgi:uncharacterized membrane protein YdjX (TVP38/TMEM64 family)
MSAPIERTVPLTPTPSRTGSLLRLGLLALVLAGVAFAATRAGLLDLRDPDTLLAAIDRARAVPYIHVLFVLTYIVVATFGLPATPFTLAGGILFGTGLGSLLNWLGATLGATGTYLLTRAVGGDALRGILGKQSARLDLLAGQRGFGTLFRLRLLPVIPFNALSVTAALSGIGMRPYMAATALGILPGTIIYTYFAGSLVGGVSGASSTARMNLIIASVLLLALSFLPTLVRRLRGNSSAGTSLEPTDSEANR